MFEFPDWSDLGSSDNLSETTRNAWDNELMRLEQYRYYFEGDVFQEKVPTEGVSLDEQPLMFPVSLNLVKMLAIAQADAAFGEWDEQPIQFGVRQDQEVKDADVAAIVLANQILDASNAKNYPLGLNSMWNLGRSIGSNPPPQVGLLEAKSAISEGVFEYINFTDDWTRVSAFAPPTAFGEDDGGGQRLGVTLEIHIWPLIKAVRRSRAYLTGSIRKALKISAIMLKQKSFSDVPVRAVNSLLEGRITPKFYNIMPRDQQAVVGEVVKLLSTTPPTISLETAQAILGLGTGEVNHIRQMLDDEDLWTTPAQEKALAAQARQKPAAQNSGSS